MVAGAAAAQAEAVRYVTGSTAQGWLDVRLDGISEVVTLPYGLKVRHTGVREGREQFVVLEGIRKGMAGSVKQPSGGGSQFGAVTHNGAATVKFDIRAGTVVYGTSTPIKAKTDPNNPTPRGRWDLAIADEAHNYGSNYVGQAIHARTWFRIGDGRDRYLHPGRVSLGCVTVIDIPRWEEIWRYLILARKDDRNVGTLHVV